MHKWYHPRLCLCWKWTLEKVLCWLHEEPFERILCKQRTFWDRRKLRQEPWFSFLSGDFSLWELVLFSRLFSKNLFGFELDSIDGDWAYSFAANVVLQISKKVQGWPDSFVARFCGNTTNTLAVWCLHDNVPLVAVFHRTYIANPWALVKAFIAWNTLCKLHTQYQYCTTRGI